MSEIVDPMELAERIMSRAPSEPAIVALRMSRQTYAELARAAWRDYPSIINMDAKGHCTFMGREIIETDEGSGVELLDQRALEEAKRPPRPGVRRYVDRERDVHEFEVEGGRRVHLTGSVVRKYGAASTLYRMGLGPNPADLPRKPLYRSGVMVGTLPGDFDTYCVRSNSPLYEPRAGDFTEADRGVIAMGNLGDGDLLAVVGFRPA